MKRAEILAVVLAVVSVWTLAAGPAVWLMEGVRVMGLLMLPTAIVASLLVLYFDWRGRLMRRALIEGDAHEDVGARRKGDLLCSTSI